MKGSVCKHILVLILGLAKTNQIDMDMIDGWVDLARKQKPVLDKNAISDTFLKYKGAEAGEIDWRPTETIPEDYYGL